ncbi:HD-GYP domain-containing protein [candidate division KSB1 bacterium]
MKLRIHRDALKLGMYIDRAVIDNSRSGGNGEKIDFIRNMLIDTPEKLKKVKSGNTKYLFIDTGRAQKKAPQIPDSKPLPQEPPTNNNGGRKTEGLLDKVRDSEPPGEPHEEILDTFDDGDSGKKIKTVRALVPFEEELEAAREIKTAAVGNVKRMLQDAAAGKSFETEDAKVQVGDMVKSVFRNRDALLSLTRLKSFDEYTFTHSVNVTVLAIALAQDLGFSKAEVNVVGLGAMLHDVGKMLVPDAVLNKPGKLTPDERREIQKHAIHGKELLEKRGDIPEVAIRMAWEHHERIDGTGYPEGKTGDQLLPESKLTAVVDVYDALTSARVYKPGMPPPQTLSFIRARADSEFEASYVERFLDVIGIYPVGSVVEFNSGQIGIVKEVNRDDLFKPNVIMVLNAKKQKIAPRPIEPSRYDRANLKIIRYHDPMDFDIAVERFLDKQPALMV